MTDAPHRVRQQQRATELCVALIRAYSGLPDLHFRGRILHQGQAALPWFAAHLHPAPESNDFMSLRGAADGLALRLTGSEPSLHSRLQPQQPVARILFDLLEQFRVESLVPETMPGMASNLRHCHRQWSLSFHHAGQTDSDRGILLYAVVQICRARVTGQQVVEETEDMLEATRAALSPLLGRELALLRQHRRNQAAYAVPAAAIAHAVAAMLDRDDEEPAIPRAGARNLRQRSVFSLIAGMETESIDGAAAAAAANGAERADANGAYRIFTQAYDCEFEPASRVRKALLREYRVGIDTRIARQGVNIGRLSRELAALLTVPRRTGWNGAQEEGRIDGRRLAQLVANPTEQRLFRTERYAPVADCVVTFLLDCSGSMKQHREALAVLVDVFARALALAGINCEILGFTTGAWNGGRAQRDWIRAGKPAQPGRLNERSHLVFKAADTPWRRARPAIAALLKEDIYREGFDGEAVDWACTRLRARNERRKLLLVISDGAPMDGATHLANGANYLDQHLRDVVNAHERAGVVEILAVGVDLDLSRYYRHSRMIDLGVSGSRMFHEIAELLLDGARISASKQ